MRSTCVKNGIGGSKMTSEVASRGQRASLEPSKATKEALGGSRMAFWRALGQKYDLVGEMRGVPLSSIWTKSEVIPHATHPCKQGAADSNAARIPAPPLEIGTVSVEV